MDYDFPESMDNDPEKALQRLHDDMELIGYIASHDLLAPVRIILQYCNILRDNHSLFPEQEQQKALQTFNDEITRLKALLEGLQEYVRLETFSFKNEALDSNELVSAAMDMLAQEIKETGATVVYDHLPVIAGHRGRLVRLFSCLLDNAIKFHGKEPPRITLSAVRDEKMWRFCVEDNGIGIAEDHQEIIFKLFQRLHTTDDYPGNGIGLSVSEKIALTHGGRLWVESSGGRGSRFYFTLPAAESVNG